MRLHASLFFVGSLLGALVAPASVLAADLLLSPDSGEYAVGKEFTVTVAVDPGTESVNASDGELSFDKDIVSVSGVSKDGSIFSLWTADPSYSNANGSINYSGGTPSAFAAKKDIIKITFKGKKVGSAKVTFKSGSVLAADGKGTDVYKTGKEATFTITEAKDEPKPKPVEAEPEGDSAVSESLGAPLATVITSTTYPKEDVYYSTTTGTFQWKLTADTTGVRTLVSQRSSSTPTQVQTANTDTLTVGGFKEGINYFLVQLRNANGWGDVAQRTVMIDQTPPLEFDITIAGEAPKFVFQTTDELSGIDHYDIFMGEKNIGTVKAADLTSAGYAIPPQEGGRQNITVKAYDKAGNIRETKKELEVPAVAKAKPKNSEEVPVQVQPTFTWERILLIIFALIIGALGTWIFKMRAREQEEKAAVMHRILELRDKNDKIFGAMREEFEHLINDLDEKPQLTPAERAFLEDVKEILEIADGLIDQSIEELKSVARGR